MVQLNNVTIAHTPRCLIPKKTAQLSKLTIAQQQFICNVINSGGQYPAATLQNLKYFNINKFICNKKLIKQLSPAGIVMLNSITANLPY